MYPYQREFGGIGNHLWTTIEAECADIDDLGWLPEGTGWYALPLE